jgi:rod shape-determining protein MreC
MKRRESFRAVFLVLVFLCLLILVFNFKFLFSFLEKGASGIEEVTFRGLPFFSESAKVKHLEAENLSLLSKLASFNQLKNDNAALSDQFQTSYPQSPELLQADIIGAPDFIPGVSVPSVFILNKGTKDGVVRGSAVVIQNNLVGVVTFVSTNLSKVNLINNSGVSFTARTEDGNVGVIKNIGALILDNILLSENLTVGEMVFTKGDIDSSGVGIPQGLLVGKIISLEKNPSSLFQAAKVQSFVDLSNLSAVFIYLPNK